MLKKIKAGELEYIFPDEKTSEIVLKIIDQNQEIISMNKTLMECLAKPLFYIEKDTE